MKYYNINIDDVYGPKLIVLNTDLEPIYDVIRNGYADVKYNLELILSVEADLYELQTLSGFDFALIQYSKNKSIIQTHYMDDVVIDSSIIKSIFEDLNEEWIKFKKKNTIV